MFSPPPSVCVLSVFSTSWFHRCWPPFFLPPSLSISVKQGLILFNQKKIYIYIKEIIVHGCSSRFSAALAYLELLRDLLNNSHIYDIEKDVARSKLSQSFSPSKRHHTGHIFWILSRTKLLHAPGASVNVALLSILIFILNFYRLIIITFSTFKKIKSTFTI